MKYVSFDKNHNLIEGVVLDNIIAMTKRGLITEAGKKLLLIPDTRFGASSQSGIREFANGQTIGTGYRERKLPRLKKSDCVPLISLAPKP